MPVTHGVLRRDDPSLQCMGPAAQRPHAVFAERSPVQINNEFARSPIATPTYRKVSQRTVSIMPFLMASFTICRCNSSGTVPSANTQIDTNARTIWWELSIVPHIPSLNAARRRRQSQTRPTIFSFAIKIGSRRWQTQSQLKPPLSRLGRVLLPVPGGHSSARPRRYEVRRVRRIQA